MGKTVMQLEYDGAVSADSAKYVYHTRPYNSTNIKFEVKNIALMDAGFYGGGHPQNAARNGQGALLVVKGKIVKLLFKDLKKIIIHNRAHVAPRHTED